MDKKDIVVGMQFFRKNVMGAEPCQVIGIINHVFDEVAVFHRMEADRYEAQSKHIMEHSFDIGLYLTNKSDA